MSDTPEITYGDPDGHFSVLRGPGRFREAIASIVLDRLAHDQRFIEAVAAMVVRTMNDASRSPL